MRCFLHGARRRITALRHDPRIASLTADRLGGPLVFYRLGNPVGYSLAKLKVKAPESTDADLHAQLQAKHWHRIAEGGSWWCLAKMAEAERGGDIERLTAELAGERAAHQKQVAAERTARQTDQVQQLVAARAAADRATAELVELARRLAAIVEAEIVPKWQSRLGRAWGWFLRN